MGPPHLLLSSIPEVLHLRLLVLNPGLSPLKVLRRDFGAVELSPRLIHELVSLAPQGVDVSTTILVALLEKNLAFVDSLVLGCRGLHLPLSVKELLARLMLDLPGRGLSRSSLLLPFVQLLTHRVHVLLFLLNRLHLPLDCGLGRPEGLVLHFQTLELLVVVLRQIVSEILRNIGTEGTYLLLCVRLREGGGGSLLLLLHAVFLAPLVPIALVQGLFLVSELICLVYGLTDADAQLLFVLANILELGQRVLLYLLDLLLHVLQ